MKLCTKCNTEKELTEFYAGNNSSWCKVCRRKDRMERYTPSTRVLMTAEETRERYNNYQRKYQREHSEQLNKARRGKYTERTPEQKERKRDNATKYNRARYGEGSEIVDDMKDWVKEQGESLICSLCLKDFNAEYIHVDHITPFSKDGKNEHDNLQIVCCGCNLAKGNS